MKFLYKLRGDGRNTINPIFDMPPTRKDLSNSELYRSVNRISLGGSAVSVEDKYVEYVSHPRFLR